eukprot:6209366-Pleurochrysis_carterae.AAC.9
MTHTGLALYRIVPKIRTQQTASSPGLGVAMPEQGGAKRAVQGQARERHRASARYTRQRDREASSCRYPEYDRPSQALSLVQAVL